MWVSPLKLTALHMQTYELLLIFTVSLFTLHTIPLYPISVYNHVDILQNSYIILIFNLL